MPLALELRKSVVTTNRINEKDTGSPDVQIAMLTERIKDLGEHLKIHKQDFASRRGLTLMVSRRNRLLKYLAKTDDKRYHTLVQRLGLRK